MRTLLDCYRKALEEAKQKMDNSEGKFTAYIPMVRVELDEEDWKGMLKNPEDLREYVDNGIEIILIPSFPFANSLEPSDYTEMLRKIREHFFGGDAAWKWYAGVSHDIARRNTEHDPINKPDNYERDQVVFGTIYPVIAISTQSQDVAVEAESELGSPVYAHDKNGKAVKLYDAFRTVHPFKERSSYKKGNGCTGCSNYIYIGRINDYYFGHPDFKK